MIRGNLLYIPLIPRLSSRLIYYNIKAWNEVISQDEVGSKKVGKIQKESSLEKP